MKEKHTKEPLEEDNYVYPRHRKPRRGIGILTKLIIILALLIVLSYVLFSGYAFLSEKIAESRYQAKRYHYPSRYKSGILSRYGGDNHLRLIDCYNVQKEWRRIIHYAQCVYFCAVFFIFVCVFLHVMLNFYGVMLKNCIVEFCD